MLVALLCISLVSSVDIIIGGDSWATHGRDPFTKMLQDKGSKMTVVNIGVGGTTSQDWTPGGKHWEQLIDVVRKNQDAKVLWMPVGGNDAQFGLPGCTPVEQCVRDIVHRVESNVAAAMKEIRSAHPTIRMIGWGYDIMAFNNGFICPLQSRIILPSCNNQPLCVNTYLLNFQTVWDDLAESAGGVQGIDVVNLLGGLQAAAGDPDASLGKPNLNAFGPNALYTDCIHPNANGFASIFSNLWDLYLHKIEPPTKNH